MDQSTRKTARRTFLAAGGLGTAALLGLGDRLEAQSTDAERANIQVVSDFCAAFAAHEIEKIGSFLAENAVFRPDNGTSSTGTAAVGRDAVIARIKRFLDRVVEFRVVKSLAVGSIVLNERFDRFNPERTLHLAGVFFMKDGKILEWTDFLF